MSSPSSVLLPPAVADGVTIRELPPEEWARASEVGGPLHGRPLPPAAHARILVGEVEGQIVAYWVLAAMAHLDPLWIDEAYRHRAHFFLGLVGGMVTLLQREGITLAYALITHDLAPTQGKLIERLGFVPIDAALYAGAIPPAED